MFGSSKCIICGAILNTDCSCPNSWNSDHNPGTGYAPATGQGFPTQPGVSFNYESETVTLLKEIRDLLKRLLETANGL